MDETGLMDQTWQRLVEMSNANRTTASYNHWIRVNLEPDKTLLTINEAMLRQALQIVLIDQDINEFVTLLRQITDEQQRLTETLLPHNPDERSAADC